MKINNQIETVNILLNNFCDSNYVCLIWIKPESLEAIILYENEGSTVWKGNGGSYPVREN